jgi:hypothetical protein
MSPLHLASTASAEAELVWEVRNLSILVCIGVNEEFQRF